MAIVYGCLASKDHPIYSHIDRALRTRSRDDAAILSLSRWVTRFVLPKALIAALLEVILGISSEFRMAMSN